MTNVFATAAFHFVNSLLDQDIKMVDENHNVTSSYRLQNYYFTPELLVKKGALDQLLRGMVNEKGQLVDFNYDDDVSLCLFALWEQIPKQ